MKNNFLPLLILLSGLFLAGSIPPLLVSRPEPVVAGIATSHPTSIPTPTLTPTPTPKVFRSSPKVTPTPTLIPTSTPLPQPTPTSTPNTQPQTNQVNVSINGAPTFTVSVTDGANHCDVLSKALSENKISSLDMRYDANYGSNAIYKINGIGKENSVWWTYKVNGQSPSQGCSHVKANNNDSVEWMYIGL